MPRIWSGGSSEDDNPDLEDIMVSEDNIMDENLIQYEILGLISYHLELSRQAILPGEKSKSILKALLKLLDNPPTKIKGFEDVHSLIDSRVNDLTPMGQDLRIFLSRNDQSHYDIRSFYMDRLLNVASSLAKISLVIKKCSNGVDGYMAGYTHYRQAMPVSFQTYFDYLSLVLTDLAEDCLILKEKLSQHCPLGYGSGYGSPVPADMERVSRLLGFAENFRNPMHGSYYRGVDESEVAFLWTKIMAAVSKIAQDLITYSSEEFRFIVLPKGYTTGSSLMPNKRNPDFLEMLQGYASESFGVLNMALSTILNKGSGYHRELQLSKDKVMAFTLKLEKVLRGLEGFFSGLEIDPAIASNLVKNSTYATMASYDLFKGGMNWKDAYKTIGSAIREGKTIPEYAPEPEIASDESAIIEIMSEIQRQKSVREKFHKALIQETRGLLTQYEL